MGNTPKLMKWDLVEDRYNKIGEGDSDTYIKPMVTSAFSDTMCGGINVLKNIKVPWDLTCDEIVYVLEGTFRLVCDGEEYICNRGDVLFIPKAQFPIRMHGLSIALARHARGEALSSSRC